MPERVTLHADALADVGLALPGASSGRLVNEIRLFVPGRGPALVGARNRQRLDRYHLGSLTRERSYKLRGTTGKGELKMLTGRSPVIDVTDSVSAEPEQWAKFPVRLAELPTGWIELTKDIWRAGPVEVTWITSDLGPWWTLAARVRATTCPRLPDEISRHLTDHRAQVSCRSYAAWLVENLGLDQGS